MDEEKRHTKILEIIKKRLIPDEIAKKDRGEVFTPLNLVREMLYGKKKDKPRCSDIHSDSFYECIFGMNANGEYIDMPDNQRLGGIPLGVWRDPKNKWLDPANGIGNFPVIAFYMLDYQLGKHVDGFKGPANRLKRHKHIIEKMLYMMEINKSNCNTTRKIFKLICSAAEPNICCSDSLKVTDEQLDRKFGTHTFDVVMGNPPFQAFQEASGARGGGSNLYLRFIERGLEWLNDGGYLVYVHPFLWRKPESQQNKGIFDSMTHKNYMQYLEIHSAKDGTHVFRASTPYDFYTIQKRDPGGDETVINDMTRHISHISLKKYDFLPNFNIEKIYNLLADSDHDRCRPDECILYSTSIYDQRKPYVREQESETFKYPLVHTTPVDGPRFKYTSDNTKAFFGIKKVIFGDGAFNESRGILNNPVVDLTGKYGMTQHAIAITVADEEDAKALVKYLTSTYFGNILLACKWSGSYQLDWRLFTYFKNNFWDLEYDANEPRIIIEDMRVPAKAAAKTRGAGSKGGRRTRKFKRRS